MKKVGLLLLTAALLLAIFFVVTSCRKDIFVKTSDTLTGDYSGEICYSVGTNPAICEFILWRFTGDGYWMVRDSTKYSPSDAYIFCDNVAGKYTLTDGVLLTQNPNQSPTVICEEGRNPKGRFVIVTRDETNLVLSQAQAGGIVWKITLVKR